MPIRTHPWKRHAGAWTLAAALLSGCVLAPAGPAAPSPATETPGISMPTTEATATVPSTVPPVVTPVVTPGATTSPADTGSDGGGAATATPLPQIVLVPTDVQYVQAQADVNLRHGPSTASPVVGSVFAGQMAAVIGRTEDGDWWQVVCPVGTTGDCFVSADPALTTPATPPLGDTPPVSDIPPLVDDLGGVVLEDLEVHIMESFPVQVQVALSGYLPDGCVRVDGIEQAREGDTVRLRINTTRVGELCTQAIRGYNQAIVLEGTEDWPPGEYLVAAGDLRQTFTLPGEPDLGDEAIPTDVKWVLVNVRQSESLFEHPGQNSAQVGSVRGGDVVRVTGISHDGLWWQIDCVNTETRHCYLSTAVASETTAPGEDQFPVVAPGTPYIMAQVDVPIYEGPGTQYLPAGLFYAGQTATATGRTPEGSWWRIDCDVTQTTARECYVTADPAFTLPSDGPSTP